MIRLNVKDYAPVSFRVRGDRNNIELSVEKAKEVVLGGSGEVYNGDYEVTPKVTSQTLDTADKFMRQNVEVHAIPYFDVSNNAGGNTVYIGTEV